MKKHITAIIAAAGNGQRANLGKNKLFAELYGKTVLEVTLSIFDENLNIDDIIIIYNKSDLDQITPITKNLVTPCLLIEGGKTRTESIKNALFSCPETDIVLIHDGARPFVDDEIISSCINGVLTNGSGISAYPAIDTMRYADETGKIYSHLERDGLYHIQTPQGFWFKDIFKAYSMMNSDDVFTDDSSIYTKFIRPSYITKGSRKNKKLTFTEDFSFEEKNMEFYTGTGYDAHKLVENRKLILGGIEIPFEKGLDGHSDADVLLHSIMDALLSASGLRDIGFYFSDKDDKYKNISSVILAKQVRTMIYSSGKKIQNISATIICEKPKLSDYIDQIRSSIANIFGIKESNVGINATTTEQMGFCGRGEGIAVMSNILVTK